MLYKQRRRLYSQNFLRYPELCSKLIRQSTIGPRDLVIEIGPGSGTITKELIKSTRKVVAIEIDEKLSLYLGNRFALAKNLEIVNIDFLKYQLPNHPYKVFANIPFNITADIIKKLTNDHNFQDGYLVVQMEAAKKFIGKPYDNKNSMMASLLKPWFDLSVCHKFSRNDFIPFPHVDSVMVRIVRRDMPLVPYFQKNIYKDFILYTYNKEKVAREDYSQILNKYHKFMEGSSAQDRIKISSKALEIDNAQKNIRKIHRTRKDKNWRRFK